MRWGWVEEDEREGWKEEDGPDKAPKLLTATITANTIAPTDPNSARPKSIATVLLNITKVFSKIRLVNLAQQNKKQG